MKAMPLPFEEFQGKGVLDFSSVSSSAAASASASDSFLSPPPQPPQKWNHHHQNSKENCYVGSSEPTSVLDTRRSPSPPTSSSTLSSSHGSGASGGCGRSTDTTTAGVENPSRTPLEEQKCGPPLGMEDWESVLSESPGQEQSILRLIMSDIEDPSLGLNTLLQSSSGSDHLHQDLEFSGGGFHDVVDQGGYGGGFEPNNNSGSLVSPSLHASSGPDFNFSNNVSNVETRSSNVRPNPAMFSASMSNPFLVSQSSGMFQQQQSMGLDEKPQIFNPQMVINQNQAQFAQYPSMFVPLTYAQLQEHHLLSPPPSKRLNSGELGPSYPIQRVPFSNPGQELVVQAQQQLQFLPQHLQQQRPTMPVAKEKMMSPAEGGKEMMNQNQLQQQFQQAVIDQFQQAVFDQLFNAAELIETGNSVLAQGILARLNHQLSPIGKPFSRAAFYFKEALQLLLHTNTSSNCSSALSPFSLICKIGAYKSFSEISPVVQFANFTCNQAILEAVEGFNRVHVIDFDIGYGGQWASFMQEVALRNGGVPSLKITAFISSSTHDEFEVSFTRENLKHFASELNLAFELELVSLESLNSGSWGLPLNASEGVAVAVNLPIGTFTNNPLSLPLILRFVKQLSPRIVVSLDRGSDRTDVPFPHQIIQALLSYSGLLESIDAANVNPDALQKIERYLLQPGIEKIVTGRHLLPKRTPSWRTLFLSSGFSPLTFSNFTESQAECLVQRTLVGGFHIEKRQSSLVLCWHCKDLISASAWRC